MGARAGMAQLIMELRRMTDTSVNEVTVNGVSYWSDLQLEEILDNYRTDVIDAPLTVTPTRISGGYSYVRYYLSDAISRFIEDENTSGAFEVFDSLGAAAPAYTFYPKRRLVLFDADTGNKSYYVRCAMYDINEAAANVWLAKAGHRISLVGWKAGTNSIEEDAEWQHCMDMYKQYSGVYGIRTTRMSKGGYSGKVYS